MRLGTRLLVVLGCAAALCACAPAALQDAGAGVATRSTKSSAVPLPTQALANIRNLNLRDLIISDERVPRQLREIVETCTQCGIDNPVYDDATGDGTADVLVPIYDDMTVAGTIIYSVQNHRVRMVFAHFGHQAIVKILKPGEVELSRNLFGVDDPACCPSGESVERYRWNGTRFVRVSETGSKPGLEPIDRDDTVVT